jgi:superfamily II DNA or RNA helicase
MNNDFKTKLQKQEFEALKDKHRVILRWATGCGKSKMTIDLVNNVLKNFSSSKPAYVLFVVAERAHINNWKEEMKKWNLNSSKMECTIICYNSLPKMVDKLFDVVVLDEGHHAFTEKRKEALKRIYANNVYILSATLSYAKVHEAEEIYGKFVTSTVSLKKAIKEDVLPDPKIYVIGLTLDNTKVNQKVIGVKGKNPIEVSYEDRFKYITKKIPCVIKCTEYQKYNHITSSMDYWKDRYTVSNRPMDKNKWVNLGSQRKRFIGELKTEYVKDLISKLKDKRYICFCTSVAQAVSLNGKYTVSSRRTTSANQSVIDAFNNKETNSLFAVSMLTEGMNLTDIDACVITQLDGQQRLFIQKLGRSLRSKSPLAFIFYYKGTQDENYLKQAIENIDEKFVEYMNVEDFKKIKV